MDKPQEAPKGHARTRSGVKATRPRSSTKGPLDDDGPLASPLSPDQVQRTLSLRSQPRSPVPGSPMLARSPAHSPAPTGKRAAPGHRPSSRQGPKDLSYLLRPEIYHPLSPLNIPPPFRNPPEPPSSDTPIPELISRGHFRAAAIAAANTLTSGTLDPTDHATIFDLLYTRLSCLTLIDATPLAAQEVKALGDLHSAFYYSTAAATTTAPSSSFSSPPLSRTEAQSENTSPSTASITGGTLPPREAERPDAAQDPQHIAPWPLRLLAVRLQALGFGDPRRAVMSYYELAREARARLAAARAAHEHSAAERWRGALAELGVRVASALVEMEDPAGAAAHLRSLAGGAGAGQGAREGQAEPWAGSDEVTRRTRVMEALVWLQLGDVQAARECVAPGGGGGPVQEDGHEEEAVQERVVDALCDMADGEYQSALEKWKALKQGVDDEMVGVNLAVCLLYVGRMQEGRDLLERLVDSGRSSHTLLFNLTTMYELCSDRSRALKQKLAERVAARGDRADGWEKTNADFKL